MTDEELVRRLYVDGTAAGADDCEAMRLIRNECRQFMTGNTDEITEEEQARWWYDRRRHANGEHRYVYRLRPWGEAVGFGYMRPDPEGIHRMWGTLGLREEYRGKGLGTTIYRHMAAVSMDGRGMKLWIKVRPDNTASMRAAEKAGFRYAFSEDGTDIVVMKYDALGAADD